MNWKKALRNVNCVMNAVFFCNPIGCRGWDEIGAGTEWLTVSTEPVKNGCMAIWLYSHKIVIQWIRGLRGRTGRMSKKIRENLYSERDVM